jgi:hypothetical protein
MRFNLLASAGMQTDRKSLPAYMKDSPMWKITGSDTVSGIADLPDQGLDFRDRDILGLCSSSRILLLIFSMSAIRHRLPRNYQISTI